MNSEENCVCVRQLQVNRLNRAFKQLDCRCAHIFMLTGQVPEEGGVSHLNYNIQPLEVDLFSHSEKVTAVSPFLLTY